MQKYYYVLRFALCILHFAFAAYLIGYFLKISSLFIRISMY